MGHWNRRQFLRQVGAIATGAIALPLFSHRCLAQYQKTFPRPQTQQDLDRIQQWLAAQDRRFTVQGSESLRQRAERRGLLYGAALGSVGLQDAAFAQAFQRECGILVPENELKWQSLCPAPDRYEFGPADRLLAFAQRHKLLMRGHTLVWNQAIPDWFKERVDRSNAEQVLIKHIHTVAGRYRGKFHSWDVVNEAVNGQPQQANGLQWSPWLDLLGPDYIALAFWTAAEADPSALRVYNDARLEYDNAEGQRCRPAVLRLLESLRARQVPVQALGIQAHLNAADPRFNPKVFRQFLRDVADLGLKILITELDVSDRHLPANFTQRDRIVAATYQDFLDVVLDEPAVIAILTWGLSDRYTWLSNYAPRDDQKPVRGLPLDRHLQRKLAWRAIAQSFDQAKTQISAEI